MDPNNTHEVIFWDNLYKLRPWLSKYPVNMTDEEWLKVLEKTFQVLKFFTSPVRAHGRGKGRILEVGHPGIWSRDINILGMVLGIYLHFLWKIRFFNLMSRTY